MMKIDFDVWEKIRGFMDRSEAERLYEVALEAAAMGPLLEIGSYCGKSGYIIGCACKQHGSVLFSIDHHRGSEEQQPGELYFDPDLFDSDLLRVNTLPFFLETIEKTGLGDVIIPVVADSALAGKMWETPLSMVFIDGGHSFKAAMNDYSIWSRHLMAGGFLVFHDIFFDPEKGGQAPRRVYETAVDSGCYHVLEMTKTLGVLKKGSSHD